MQPEVSFPSSRRPKPVGYKAQIAGRFLVVVFIIISILVVFFSACTILIALGDFKFREASTKLQHFWLKPSDVVDDAAKTIFVCSDVNCEEESGMLVNQTSQQVNPCENFYRHVCSKWIDENYLTRYETERSRMRLINNGYISQIHDIFKSMTIDSALQTAKEKAAALFIGCMDRDTIEELGADPLRKFLFNFGFKTFPTNLHERKTLDVSQVAGLVLRKLGISTFVSASVVADPELKEDRILSIDGPDLPLGGRLVEDNVFRLSWYQGVMAKTFYYLTKDEMVSSRLAEDIFNLENDIALAKLSTSKAESSVAAFERVLLKNFESISQWNWAKFFCAVMGVEPSSVTKDTYIAVKSVGYVKELGYVFGNNSKSTLLDLIAWRLMRAVSPLLPEAFRDLTLSFAGQQTMGGAPPPYDLACYNLLEPPLRFAFARAYVEEHGHRYTEPLMAHVRKTIRHLQDEMLQMLNGSSLMDKHTFNNAMDKIRDMKWRMVDPLKSTPSQNLSLILEKAGDISSSGALNGYYIVSEVTMEYYWKGDDNHNGWTIPLLATSPSYDVLRNSLVVPLGALQAPLFYEKMLPPLHLARFGFLTARELLRSLVGEGASVGRRGSNTPWWSEPASSFFKKKSYCFVKQYKDYSMLEMNPFESVNENLLDNAALQVAHKVYWKTVMSKAPPLQPLSLIEWKQGEYALPSGKLFFYAYASNMCGRLSSRADYDLRMRGPFAPIEMRVNVPLMNMRAFTDAFECERDARMNPDRKCIIL